VYYIHISAIGRPASVGKLEKKKVDATVACKPTTHRLLERRQAANRALATIASDRSPGISFDTEKTVDATVARKLSTAATYSAATERAMPVNLTVGRPASVLKM